MAKLTVYDKIRLNYQRGYWTKQQVADMIKFGHITEEQYKEIVGEDYVPPTTEA